MSKDTVHPEMGADELLVIFTCAVIPSLQELATESDAVWE